MISPFSPAGRSAERMRGDEGVFPRVLTVTPPHPPFGHLLPAGEKRGDAENPLTSIFLAFGNIASVTLQPRIQPRYRHFIVQHELADTGSCSM